MRCSPLQMCTDHTLCIRQCQCAVFILGLSFLVCCFSITVNNNLIYSLAAFPPQEQGTILEGVSAFT